MAAEYSTRGLIMIKTDINKGSPSRHVSINRQSLPVLLSCDVVVAGGSFAGVSAALEISRAGLQVILVEPRTYLGREITANLRPWIHEQSCGEGEELPEWVRACLKNRFSEFGRKDREIPLHMDSLKIVLEDLLIESGVKLIYASLPAGLYDHGEKKHFVIANKSSRQIIECRMVIDATEKATVSRIAGGSFKKPGNRSIRYRKTLEFTKVSHLKEKAMFVPEKLGIVNNQVLFHQGYSGNDHVLAEFSLDFAADDTIDASTAREVEGSYQAMKLASYLIQNEEAFKGAAFVSSSNELKCCALASELSGSIPKWAQPLSSSEIRPFAGPNRNLWCLSAAARLEDDLKSKMGCPVLSSRLGKSFAQGLISQWEELLKHPNERVDHVERRGEILKELEVSELESPKRGGTYKQAEAFSETIPVLRHTDVLVVGGGTSGATAATTSASEGMNTVLLEMNPGLGGTGTFGGVDSYWFGRRLGFNEKLNEKVEQVHQAIQHKRNKWNIEAKKHVLLREAEEAGVEILFNVITTGALMDGNHVRGVVVATRWGLFAVTAETVIDATGDGDIAAFAGADFVYGSSRDHVSMWYSLAQFSKPGLSRNNFTSMVDVSNVEDYTRAILAGRRRKRDDHCHDHGIYVATRESRHIWADVVLTQTDQLVQRKWPDVINIHFSNTDIKGKSQSNWIHLGLIPPNLEVEIPYRILLPKGLEGLLIAGKAMSVTHDAFAVVRMQADLENLGGIVGIASAMAVKSGRSVREINIADLQKRIVAEGMLPEKILGREIKPSEPRSEDELKELVHSLAGDQPLYAYSDMGMDEVYHDRIPLVEVCTEGPQVIPVLESALQKAEGVHRIRIAQALAWHKSPAAVSVLHEEIDKQFAGKGLPSRDSHIRYAGEPPDQGAMPDAAYLIYTAGLIPDKRNLEMWKRVADRIAGDEKDLSDGTRGLFYYVDAVCFGIERLADQEALPVLVQLHSQNLLRAQKLNQGFQVDYFPERQAMLELSITRAMARCGSPEGAAVLISYLDDSRALLAEQAHSELAAISGQDHGKDRERWMDWLDETKDNLQPCPVREDFI